MALVLSDEEVAMLMPEGKTKQEKIREGVAVVAEDTWYKHDYDVVWDEVAKAIVAYLHSQGVVIKVDRELPVSIPVLPKFHKQGIITDDDLLEYAKFTEVLNRMEYIKAGFEAVETIAPSDAAMSR